MSKTGTCAKSEKITIKQGQSSTERFFSVLLTHIIAQFFSWRILAPFGEVMVFLTAKSGSGISFWETACGLTQFIAKTFFRGKNVEAASVLMWTSFLDRKERNENTVVWLQRTNATWTSSLKEKKTTWYNHIKILLANSKIKLVLSWSLQYSKRENRIR